MSDNPLALVVGVGAATGAAVCERLSGEYRICMVARSTTVTGELAQRLPDTSAFKCDVSDAALWRATLDRIVAEHGQPSVILVNTEGGGWGDYNEIDVDLFAKSFEVNVVSLLVLVQTLFPTRDSIAAPCRIVISSSPAAYESTPRFVGLAPSRAGQRVLAETLHTMLSDSGVELCVLSIAGAIDEPKMRAAFADEPDEFFIRPTAIAERIWTLFHGEFTPQASITS